MRAANDRNPSEAIIAITYRCNARCQMCNIWRLNQDNELCVDAYKGLPATLKRINITGGEPFLRRDLPEITKIIYKLGPKPDIVISTNGLNTDVILSAMENMRKTIPNIGIGISIDGIERTHDAIRGVNGAFRKAITTLNALKQRGFSNTRIAFTATNKNVEDITKVYDLATLLGIAFSITVAQNSDHYYHTQKNDMVRLGKFHDAIEYLAKRELLSLHPKRWFRAYLNFGLDHFVKEKGRLLKCNAANDFFFLAPEGTIFPCLTVSSPIGNLTQSSFREIWDGANAQAIRKTIKACEGCWMTCTVRSSMKRNFPRIIAWVAKEKMCVHARSIL